MKNNSNLSCLGPSKGRRRGASALEMAIALPVLLLIIFGAVDLGRFATTYIAVSNSARAAAGYGSMNPPTLTTMLTWNNKLRQQAVAEMQGNIDADEDYAAADVTVTSTVVIEDATTGFRRVDVMVSCPFETVLNLPGLPHEFDITRKVSIRAIR